MNPDQTVFFHIDVNSAFLSWSSVHNLEFGLGPDLRNIPAIIGGDASSRHGIVLAKSIPAKRYGIETAEPIVSAQRKCPDLYIQGGDFQIYSRYSKALMEHLATFCPEIEKASIDECYMDFTPVLASYESPEKAALLIKDSVREKFGFTVNIGISDKKVLAKMASDFEKPDKVHTLYSHEIEKKMWPLPVGDLFLCGKSSRAQLYKLGIRTIGELAKADPQILSDHLKSMGLTLYRFANGIDDSTVVTQRDREKSIGSSTTGAEDIFDEDKASSVLLSLSETVAARLRRAGLKGCVITCEVKYATFRTISKQRSIDPPTNHTDSIHKAAFSLFQEIWNGEPVRLLGVRASKVIEASEPVQLSIFDYSIPDNTLGVSGSDEAPLIREEKRERLDAALDQIRNKYGKDAIKRGSLL